MEDGANEHKRKKRSKSKRHDPVKRKTLPLEAMPIEKEAPMDDATKSTEERAGSPESPCSICLGKLENKSFTDSCFHTFCYVCLLEWSKVKAVCPLCKQPFKSIIHNVRSIEDYDQYEIKQASQQGADDGSQGRFRYRTTRRYAQWEDEQVLEQRRQMGLLQRPTRTTSAFNWRRYRQSATSAFRKRVYAKGMRVKDLRSSRGQAVRFRQVSPAFFSENPACSHRLVPWLNRELNVLLTQQAENVHFVLELILDIIKRFDIRSEEFYQHLQSLLGRRTEHFIHEFHQFARAPYDMLTYDRHAVYDEEEGQSTDIHTIDHDSSQSSSSDAGGDDDDVVVMSSPQPGLPAAPTTAPDHSYPSSASMWPMQASGFSLTLSPLFYRVENFLASVRSAPNTMLGGWESPDTNTSSSVWASSMNALYRQDASLWPLPGTSSQQERLPTRHHDVTDGDSARDRRRRSPSTASSHASDIVMISAEKPWGERSPIQISSDSSEEEIEVIEEASKTKSVFIPSYIYKSPSNSSTTRRKHAHNDKRRHRSRSRERRHSHSEKAGDWRHKKYDYVLDRCGSGHSHHSARYGSGRHHSDYSASGYEPISYPSPRSTSGSHTSRQSSERRSHHRPSDHSHDRHRKSSRHSKHKKHRKHKHKKHKKSKRSRESSDDDIIHLSTKNGGSTPNSERKPVKTDGVDGPLSEVDTDVSAAGSSTHPPAAAAPQVYKKHSSGHKRSKFTDTQLNETKDSTNDEFSEGASGNKS